MIGFVLLQRDIMDWEWYQHPTVARLYIHLILKVNFKEKKWQGVTIKRGQLVTSVNSLSSELRLSNQKIRTAIQKLEESEHIIKSATNSFTLITVVNYDKYQSADSSINKRDNNQKAIQKQSNSNPITSTKQSNKGNNLNKETIEMRMNQFQKQVFKNSHYSNNILKGFYNYWTELDLQKNKMRFENEKYFEISKRLEKWKKNEKQSNFNSKQSNSVKFQSNR